MRGRMRRDALVALAAGVALLVLGLALFARAALAGEGGPYVLLFSVELAGGREAAIPAGLYAGLTWPQAALATTLVEWTMLLLGFPLLVLAGARLARIRRVEAMFHRARVYAQERPATGVMALGALTLAPFVPVGALTSVLVGEFLGLPSHRLLPVLLGAELAANVAFAYSSAALLGVLPDPRILGALAAGMLLLGVVLSALWGRRKGTSSL